MAEESSSGQAEITMSVIPCLHEPIYRASRLTNCYCSTVKGPSELKLSITISPSKSVTELKEVIASRSDVEKDRQRLIYSGLCHLFPGLCHLAD